MEWGRGDVVEHVHVSVDISSNTRRGLFSIELQSPSGTVSQLLAPRPLDNSLSGEYLYNEVKIGIYKMCA